MASNLAKYQEDLDRLIEEGGQLVQAMRAEYDSENFRSQLEKAFKGDELEISIYLGKLPSFVFEYQTWYSEALILLQQLLPRRVPNFVRLYEKPSTGRAELTYANYVIEDALHGLLRRIGGGVVLRPEAAIAKFVQQVAIVKAIKRTFESSLFEIKKLVQADLFESELESARELNRQGFARCAGAIAGVVLESHLSQICEAHQVEISSTNPTISTYNNELKAAEVYDTLAWRKIQVLGDLRNLCDHKKHEDPTKEKVLELIEGVEAVTKTLS